ncbi:FxsB family cyclophane-forming radical SAM/SPASM peptide maturase [Streptomyces sp. NPDC101234]|uniref:FxsB family cyclophane-forming radical SAM/SPASM peptide maturase n=1 Tax=Streptomyces sp. NPDC101234 TaxID=3366138 RepID=UPI0037F30F39
MTGSVVPLRQLVLKVHSRCDLACRHCYVYEHADQSWTSRPTVISEEIVSRTALRLAEHAKAHELASVQVILHGGEPLLAGPGRLRFVCEQLRGALRGISDLDLRIHTNGLQLNQRYLDLFAEYDVRVGISLDGDRAANDRHRLYRDGRSSYDKVLAAIARLRQDRYRHLFAGILCTVDVRNDPVAVYDALALLRPPRIDFLLPHATWDTPPPRPQDTATPYADWLLAIHDRWTGQGRPVPVRLFDSVISTLGGGPAQTESMGLESADVVVVETDGTYEQADSLKTAYDGAPGTGKDVFRHTLDEVSRHPGMTARQHGLDDLSAQCRACPVVRSCGGGLFAHRYRGDGSGFDNPSVYCADLKQLVESLGTRTGVDAARPVDGFDALADGTDDGTAVRALAEIRQHVTLDLLKELNAEPARPAGKLWEPAWQLALDLQLRDERVLPSLLAHPYTRPWAIRCLDATASPDHLASLVAAAALPVGAADSVEVPVTDGIAYLPGAGRLRVETVGDSVELTSDVLRCAGWEPVRRLRFGGCEVALDDIDPYRDSFAVPVRSRLTDDEVALWRQVLPQAWQLIVQALPGTAAGMAAGLRVLSPLVAPPGPDATGAGSGFAALGLHLAPRDPEPVRAAADLVRGFRLGILDVLLDECELHDEADTSTGALLADTYARAATDTLHDDPRSAARTRARWRELSDSASLTALGRRFVDGIGRSL